AGNARIVVLHLLPNCAGPPLSQAVGYIGTAITTESVLSYLGLGVPPPHPSWGRMIQEGTRSFFESAPWLVIFPGLALFLFVIFFSVLGEYLRRR
ncbi:MAG: ABC transporter permease subunit, partial [Spirochaetales bacterium]|nr:ABC transporter permease subunit [Spirochaetales bacterium]